MLAQVWKVYTAHTHTTTLPESPSLSRYYIFVRRVGFAAAAVLSLSPARISFKEFLDVGAQREKLWARFTLRLTRFSRKLDFPPFCRALPAQPAFRLITSAAAAAAVCLCICRFGGEIVCQATVELTSDREKACDASGRSLQSIRVYNRRVPMR